MIAADFEYDGLTLSQFGYIIGHLDNSSGIQEKNAGSVIKFNLVSANRGNTSYHTSSVYEEFLETEIEIIKNLCDNDNYIISQHEFRDLMRWLNRENFHKLRFISENENDDDIYYYASFNCSKLELEDNIVGVKLKIQTNAPYGFGKEVNILRNLEINSGEEYASTNIIDISDNVGESYPTLTITPSNSGVLEIKNLSYNPNYSIVIQNCSAGETIVLDNEHQIIASTDNSHDIANDFNYHWLVLTNSYDNRQNEIVFSLPCSIKISYEPIIKYGF